MAVSHPDEAMVRLHHLARREPRIHARDALVELATGDRRLLRLMLSRVTDTSPEKTRWRSADAGLFLDLAAPDAFTNPGVSSRPLIAEETVRRQLADGWRFAFTDLTHEEWHVKAAQWLRHAASCAIYREVLMDILIAGGESLADVLARLYAMTRTHELRAAVSDLVLQKINTVQGVQLT